MRLSTALAESSRRSRVDRLEQLREDELDHGCLGAADRRPGRPDRRGRAVRRRGPRPGPRPALPPARRSADQGPRPEVPPLRGPLGPPTARRSAGSSPRTYDDAPERVISPLGGLMGAVEAGPPDPLRRPARRHLQPRRGRGPVPPGDGHALRPGEPRPLVGRGHLLPGGLLRRSSRNTSPPGAGPDRERPEADPPASANRELGRGRAADRPAAGGPVRSSRRLASTRPTRPIRSPATKLPALAASRPG